MDDLILKSSLGSAGFFATVGLSGINQFVSLLVGCATLVFLGLSIYKLMKEIKG